MSWVPIAPGISPYADWWHLRNHVEPDALHGVSDFEFYDFRNTALPKDYLVVPGRDTKLIDFSGPEILAKFLTEFQAFSEAVETSGDPIAGEPDAAARYDAFWKSAGDGKAGPYDRGTIEALLGDNPAGESFELFGKTLDQAQSQVGESLGSTKIPLPAGTVNPEFSTQIGKGDWLDGVAVDEKDLPPKEAVIVGIIDAAIALGHKRFLQKDGKSTRFLAAWQQSAPIVRQANGAPAQVLPFGRELLKPEIDALLAKHSRNGVLDEEGFNTEAGLLDMVAARGQREMNHAVAHGTHVADMAAGFDIHADDVTDEMLRQRPIIAVNLPNRYAIGASGTFLETFVMNAIARIVELSDKLWSLRPDLSEDEKTRGYPVVINLSYGLQAGPKDGSMMLEVFLANMMKDRADKGKAPVRIVLPAGNDNLSRGNAVWNLQQSKSPDYDYQRHFQWRLLPEDQTSNYLEIWTGQLDERVTNPKPLSITVTLPDGTEYPGLAGGGGASSYVDLGDFARLYCHRLESRKTNWTGKGNDPRPESLRQRFVLCVAPTLASGPDEAVAPAGLWDIKVELDSTAYPKGLDVFVHVQSDQSTRPGGETGLVSYLDNDRYQMFDENGREIDTYRFTTADLKPWQANRESNREVGPVQRKGTLNAIASLDGAVVVAGHRVSDMRPAAYSSTGAGQQRLAQARPSPTLSYPSDDGPAHPGLLAAGSRSGSVVLMQGTSFATAQATREVADRLAGWKPGDTGGSEADMIALAKKHDPNDGARFGRIFDWKSGHGRRPGTPGLRAARREPG